MVGSRRADGGVCGVQRAIRETADYLRNGGGMKVCGL